MLYSEEEKTAYSKELNVICLNSELDFYGCNSECINTEDLIRYKIYRNLVENLFVYFKNKYFFNNPRGINPKYVHELNFIANKIRDLDKPLQNGEFSRQMVGDFLLSDKKMLQFAINK